MIRTINGIPTKKYIGDLCDRHGLSIYPLDTYKNLKHIVWSSAGRPNANDKARLVADELEGHGFTVEFKAAQTDRAITGSITITAKGG